MHRVGFYSTLTPTPTTHTLLKGSTGHLVYGQRLRNQEAYIESGPDSALEQVATHI